MSLAEISIDLIESARGGDAAAIETLLKTISPDVYRIAFSMLRDHDSADEVAQESLIRVFRYLPKLKEIEKFSSWTMRVVVNQVQSWRMRQSRQRLVAMPEGLEPEAGKVVALGVAEVDPRAAAMSGDTRRQIEEALATLPNRQQAAIVLFEVEGSSIREVAAAMQCSEGAVKFNIHEARKKLQKRLAHLFCARAGSEAKRAAASES